MVFLGMFLLKLSAVTLVAFLYNKNPEQYFDLVLFFAKRGYYRHSGTLQSARDMGIPICKVYFKGGGLKGEMPLGEAVVYAATVQGTLKPL